jgi:hypothetical protein
LWAKIWHEGDKPVRFVFQATEEINCACSQQYRPVSYEIIKKKEHTDEDLGGGVINADRLENGRPVIRHYDILILIVPTDQDLVLK